MIFQCSWKNSVTNYFMLLISLINLLLICSKQVTRRNLGAELEMTLLMDLNLIQEITRQVSGRSIWGKDERVKRESLVMRAMKILILRWSMEMRDLSSPFTHKTSLLIRIITLNGEINFWKYTAMKMILWKREQGRTRAQRIHMIQHLSVFKCTCLTMEKVCHLILKLV